MMYEPVMSQATNVLRPRPTKMRDRTGAIVYRAGPAYGEISRILVLWKGMGT